MTTTPNPYQKTWPDLMQGKKILYVHGFASSGQSGTVRLLRTFMPNATVVAPDLPIHPFEALDLLHSVCEAEQPDLIIGSSMGGMMAEQLRGYDRILVNPAFQMGETMGTHGMVGKLTFQNPRQDGVQEMVITKAIQKEYRDLTEQCFREEGTPDDATPGMVSADEDRRVWALFGDSDPIVHTHDLFHEHYTQAVWFHGEHRLIDTVVHHALMPVVRWIDDRQEGRQREVVYIDFECLHDSRWQATPSMLKAVESLLDRYDVYFVTPAPLHDPIYLNKVYDWLTQFVAVPAFRHIVSTSRPDLLYGDFLISPATPRDAMATTLEYGSDQFKTWEELITYFSRL